MSQHTINGRVPRRSFLSRVGAGAAAVGAALGLPSAVQAQSGPPAAAAAPSTWHPARHPEDDWYEETTAKHRFFLDTTTPQSFGQAVFFARNFFVANASGYGLTDADVAQVICARHQSTSFAFTDAMWKKYSAALSERAGDFVDPKSGQMPTTNLFMASAPVTGLSNNGVSLDAVLKRGLRLAVCGMATRATASLIAQKTGANVDEVVKELTSHLVPNAHMVAAGIVAVNRAQERGYTFAYVT